MSCRCALEDTKRSLQERVHRWQQIEYLCGFSFTACQSTNQSPDARQESLTAGLHDPFLFRDFDSLIMSRV